MRRGILALAATVLFSAAAFAQTDGGTRLLRYPDINKDKIVFVYGGDLWLAGAEGGTARRLTSDLGEELFPKFSPDGKWVAFTGQYGGNHQVYVISVDGGTPRQLTFHNDIGEMPPRGGVDNQVLGWTPDGKQILFGAHRTPWSERIARFYLVPADGGMEVPLPIPEGSTGSFSADGTKLAYTPVQTEFRGWKRYHGGRAQDVWVYDLAKNTSERLTDYDGTDGLPMWIGNTIYFVSDREGGILNLYALDPATRQVRKATNHQDWDVLWASSDGRRIVYENGGFVWLFDPASGPSGQPRRVAIQITGDLPHTLPYFKNVAADIQSMGLSPTGKRAVFGARGEVFTVPAENGEARNITRTPASRETDATWSPDGRWIAYLSDRTGEYELWMRKSDGSGEERRITTDGDVYRLPPLWSPDSKKLAFGDENHRLRWVDVDSGKVVDADRSSIRGDIADYRWSPDSRWLTYTKPGANRLSSIWVYSLEHGKAQQLTSGFTNDAEPVFDPQGRYLYFFSNRDFNLTVSGFEFDYVYTNPTRVYVAVLSKDGPGLFLPKSDEEIFKEQEKSDKAAKPGKRGHQEPPKLEDDASMTKDGGKRKDGGDQDGGKADGPDSAAVKTKPVRIDVDGFELRVRALPGPPGVYQSLAAGPDAAYYIHSSGPGTVPELKMFDLKEQKESTVLGGVASFELSADGKKILYRQGKSFGIVDARPEQKAGDGKLALDRMQLQIDPRAEWNEMYVDAWRTFRDFFYDPNLHGVDWKALRAKYGQLVPYLATRSDLDYILTELGSEISAGHVYVERGDETGVTRVEHGLLGAEVEADRSGYFRITKIFPGENWHPDFRSPLTEPGIHVATGDFILAVDGQTTKGADNFYRLMQARADRVVTLLVNGQPSLQGAHEERVRPVASEQNLRYLDWVQATRAKVDKASGGRIGYLHLPDTATKGNRELFKYFYPQANKDALILDDRWNGGGFVPDRMIALLSRPLLNYWAQRNSEPFPTPLFFNNGPKATLINGEAGSGGDAFPFYFRELHLGPLIGTRTWGGLAGLTNSPSLLDGGSLSVPSFRFYTTEGKWAVENEGVAPDIEVIDRAEEVAKGHDPSLERAIAYLLDELKKNPPKKVPVPTPPKGGAPR